MNVEELSPQDSAWVLENEGRWQRAYRIAATRPHLDVGDIYHVLCTLHETPAERMRRSFAHGRLRLRPR